MTEDENDRMERAERIRQLRQGSDGSDGGSGDSDTTADTAASGDADTDDAAADGDANVVDAQADTNADVDPTDAESAGDGQGQPAAAPAAGGGSADGGGGSASGGGTAAQVTSGTTGVALPDQEEIEAALEEVGETAATAEPAEDAVGRTAREQSGTTITETTTRVLEFELGEELLCIDIAGIEEIVKRETVTRVPNTPEHVGGVVDLRGQITTILDAKGMLDIDEEGAEALIVVFAPDAYEEHGAVGWIVDEVRQVRPVTDDQLRTPPTDDDYVEGVIDREESDELVVWVRPEIAMRTAFGDDEDE